MHLSLQFLLLYLVVSATSQIHYVNNINGFEKLPTIGISILVRNKAYALPYFLSCLRQQDYPKKRLYIWIYSDYNIDNSNEIIDLWKKRYGGEYNAVYITMDTKGGPLLKDQNNSFHWSPERFKHIIFLREKALRFARKTWADYAFMLDADAFLTDPKTLKSLVSKRQGLVAPMLVSDGLYSNFWGGMTENYYYKRTDNYETILNRDTVGCFPVPMIHSAVLINMKTEASDRLTYDPNKVMTFESPNDDIITFAVNAKKSGLNLTVCNDRHYGFIPIPIEEKGEVRSESDQILNIKMEALGRGVIFPVDKPLEKFISYPKQWKFGLNEIFVINLERRVERKELMQRSMKELGMEAKFVKAVDGKQLDLRDLRQFSVTLLPHYEDPYHKRPMKAGEIGCFLSHYNIWKEIAAKNLKRALILEDDIHFVPYFRQRFNQLLKEIEDKDWDLVYIGRKIMFDGKEKWVTQHTTVPLYSYWTLGYLISEQGARKLIKAEPLSKMLPVDEFLPIMFDQHPNETWKSFFPTRDLKALSAAPLLVFPTHYTGQEGYVSDTEDSSVLPPPAAPAQSPLSTEEVMDTLRSEL